LRGELEQAFAALHGADVGGAAMAGRDRNQNLHDQNLHDLLALQEELVHELQMMKRDMSMVASHNKALESEKESLLRELDEYTSGRNSQSDLIAPQQRKRAQRSAAPGGLNRINGNGVAILQVILWIFCVNL
jgi:chromosome segregation ATPase